MQCWKRSPLGKPQRFHRCTRSLNVVCKCKMCTSAFSMDGQRWFRCRWWSVDSPLHPHRHRRRWLTRDRPHRPPWMSIWRHHHRIRPLQRQLLVVRHLHQCLRSSGPLLPVVDSPRVPSMLHVDASSSLAIAQMGWPHLPPPTGGPNGPRSGRRVGRLGGGGGEQRGKPRRGRCTAQRRGKPRHGHALRSRPALGAAPKGTGAAAMAARRAPSQGRSAAATLAALGVAPEALDRRPPFRAGGSARPTARARGHRRGTIAWARGHRRASSRRPPAARRSLQAPARRGSPWHTAAPTARHQERARRPHRRGTRSARDGPQRGRLTLGAGSPRAKARAAPWLLLAAAAGHSPGRRRDDHWRRLGNRGRLQGAVRVGNPSRPNII
jgi:hypothetical protein